MADDVFHRNRKSPSTSTIIPKTSIGHRIISARSPSFLVLLIIYIVSMAIRSHIPTASAETVTQRADGEKTCYCLEEVVSDLYNPVMASFVRRTENSDQVEQIIVAEQRGVIKLVTGSGKVKTMLDIRHRVVSTDAYGDERGLLSAVPSADFKNKGKIYVAYTRWVILSIKHYYYFKKKLMKVLK